MIFHLLSSYGTQMLTTGPGTRLSVFSSVLKLTATVGEFGFVVLWECAVSRTQQHDVSCL